MPLLGAMKAWAAGLSLALLLAGCRRHEPSVVVYASVDEEAARPVLKEFERRTGIRVDAVYDSEVSKTTGLASRLRLERERPRADVFWSSESAQAGLLADDGLIAGGRESLQPCLARARVLVYSLDRVDASKLPASWWDLASPEWASRLAMADPRFGSTGGHLGAMKVFADMRGTPELFRDWCERINHGGVHVLVSGNSGVVRAVASGEADVGMTDSDDALAAKDQGAKIGFIALRHGEGAGEGPLAMRGCVGAISGGPHSTEAAALAAFLASPEAQRMLAKGAPGFYPIDSLQEAGLTDPLRVDERAASKALPDALAIFSAARGQMAGAGAGP